MSADNLSEKDHTNLDRFLGLVLDRHKSGELSRARAIGTLAHVIAALDKGNLHEVRQWLEEGSSFLKDGD